MVLVVCKAQTPRVIPARTIHVAQYPGQTVRYHNDVSLHVGRSEGAAL